MAKKYNWIGRRYGKLLIIKELPNNRFFCKCDCGNVVEVFKTNLSTGQKVNCGCETRLKLDYTNRRFGNLTALNYDVKKRKWLCKCDCGNSIYVTARNLTYGNTTSCGCKKVIKLLDNMYDCDTNIHQFNLFDDDKVRNNNTSGKTGVTYYKKRNKWVATIMFQKKKYFLGYYDKKESAIEARKLAEEKLHGQFLSWYENEYKVGKK